MLNINNLIASLSFFFCWIWLCLKVIFIFCGIVMIRVCTPRFGLGAITRLAWGSLFMYLCLFFILYLIGILWF